MTSEGTPPLSQGSREGEDWEEYEATVLLAACPETKQNYDDAQGWVIELAELLGRSPGSISKHLGNLFAVKQSKGLPHVAKVFGVIYDRYRDDEPRLLRDAAAIRERLYAQRADPRAEVEVSEAMPQELADQLIEGGASPEGHAQRAHEFSELERHLRENFAEARLPPGTIIVYRRRGSLWVGVVLALEYAISRREDARRAFIRALEILSSLHRPVRVTPAGQDLLEQRDVALADRRIAERVPGFQIERLTDGERVRLALKLVGLKSLINWKPSAARLELFGESGADEPQRLMSATFGIDASKLGNADLLRLLELAQDGRKKGLL